MLNFFGPEQENFKFEEIDHTTLFHNHCGGCSKHFTVKAPAVPPTHVPSRPLSDPRLPAEEHRLEVIITQGLPSTRMRIEIEPSTPHCSLELLHLSHLNPF